MTTSTARKADFVPTISLANFENRKEEIARQLYDAATKVGFFYVADHGIPNEDVQKAFAWGKRFLDLPKDVKARWPFNPDRYLGWRGPDELETVTGNRLWEWYSVGHYGNGGYDVKQQKFIGEEWPPEEELNLQGFRDFALDFQNKLHTVALTIFRAFAIGLQWPEDYFEEPFDVKSEEQPSFVAWNYYPPIKEEDAGKLPPRLHAHADMDVMTLLFQQDGDIGLEIAPGKDIDNQDLIEDVGNIWNGVPKAREWFTLDPKPGCLTVNIGDGLARWTDGAFRSTYHRVRAPGPNDPKGERRSIPYFVNPKLNYVIQGPEKKFSPVTGFDLLSKTGNAYVARKNDPEKVWQKAAYTEAFVDENAHNKGAAIIGAAA